MSQHLQPPKIAVSVLIVTADNMTGELLKNAFARGRTEFAIETLTGTSQDVIGALGTSSCDVALVCDELEDGPGAGLKVLQKLRNSHQGTAVIMLLQGSKPHCVVGAFREGARGVFYRTDSLKALSKCIRMVHKGQIWAGNEDIQHVFSALAHVKPLQLNDAAGAPLLTHREQEVVHLVADGLKNREIATRLNIAEHSIRNYLYRIFDKLGVSTRVELILYAFSRRDRGDYVAAAEVNVRAAGRTARTS